MTLVENTPTTTTRRGGVTGAGFQPGVSGNPGGRPKGLARRVRELVGDDGHEIIEFMFETMNNHKVRMADRLEAAAWLADRGFGKAELAINLEVGHPGLDLRKLSTSDLEALVGIVERAGLSAPDVLDSGELRLAPVPELGVTRSSPRRSV
jgi:hypothetical protein